MLWNPFSELKMELDEGKTLHSRLAEQNTTTCKIDFQFIYVVGILPLNGYLSQRNSLLSAFLTRESPCEISYQSLISPQENSNYHHSITSKNLTRKPELAAHPILSSSSICSRSSLNPFCLISLTSSHQKPLAQSSLFNIGTQR